MTLGDAPRTEVLWDACGGRVAGFGERLASLAVWWAEPPPPHLKAVVMRRVSVTPQATRR